MGGGGGLGPPPLPPPPQKRSPAFTQGKISKSPNVLDRSIHDYWQPGSEDHFFWGGGGGGRACQHFVPPLREFLGMPLSGNVILPVHLH